MTTRVMKRATCPECGREMTKAGLVTHMKWHRAAELPDIACPHCPRTFKFAGGHAAHVLSHDNELRAIVRFWPRVDKNGPVPEIRPELGPCWLWTGPLSHHGYGVMHVPPATSTPAYRYAYEVSVGPVPKGLELDHLCRVQACVNPSHLEPVTHQENMRRSHRYNRVECELCGARPLASTLARHMERQHPAYDKTQETEALVWVSEVREGGD